MAQRSQVPKFGNWESEENVPYTDYFEKARKGKGGVRMNPNDPQDDTPPIQAPPFLQEAKVKGQMGTSEVRSKPERGTSQKDGELQRRTDGELQRRTDSPLHHDTVVQTSAVDLSHQNYGGVRSGSSKVESEAPKGSDVLRPMNECQFSQEEGDLRGPADSPLWHETFGRRTSVDPHHHRHGGASTGETPKRVTRQSAGSDRSIDHSPLHPHYQPRAGGKSSGVSSPSWERKGSSEGNHGLNPSTPGRSRLRSVTRGDDTPDHSPAVPKFGDWDESDPASAEGYTHIFNKVREEKQSGAGMVPVMATETSYSNGQKKYGKDDSKGCCCFPWSGK